MEEVFNTIKQIKVIENNNDELRANNIIELRGRFIEKKDKEYTNDVEGELLQELEETKDVEKRKNIIKQIKQVREEKLDNLYLKLKEEKEKLQNEVEGNKEVIREQIDANKEEMRRIMNNIRQLKNEQGSVRAEFIKVNDELRRQLQEKRNENVKLNKSIKEMEDTLRKVETEESSLGRMKQAALMWEQRNKEILEKTTQEEEKAWEEKEKADREKEKQIEEQAATEIAEAESEAEKTREQESLIWEQRDKEILEKTKKEEEKAWQEKEEAEKEEEKKIEEQAALEITEAEAGEEKAKEQRKKEFLEELEKIGEELAWEEKEEADREKEKQIEEQAAAEIAEAEKAVAELEKIKKEEEKAWKEKEEADREKEKQIEAQAAAEIAEAEKAIVELAENRDNESKYPNEENVSTVKRPTGVISVSNDILKLINIFYDKILVKDDSGEYTIELENAYDEETYYMNNLSENTKIRLEQIPYIEGLVDNRIFTAVLRNEEQLNSYLDLCELYQHRTTKTPEYETALEQFLATEKLPIIEYDCKDLRKSKIDVEEKVNYYNQAIAAKLMFKDMGLKDKFSIKKGFIDRVYFETIKIGLKTKELLGIGRQKNERIAENSQGNEEVSPEELNKTFRQTLGGHSVNHAKAQQDASEKQNETEVQEEKENV